MNPFNTAYYIYETKPDSNLQSPDYQAGTLLSFESCFSIANTVKEYVNLHADVRTLRN